MGVNIWSLAFAAWALFDPSPIGKCDPINGPKLEWSKADRRELRKEVQDAGRELGAAPVFLTYLDAVTERESRYTGSRWHDDGRGLGPHGVNHRIHAKRWPRPLVPDLCNSRASVLVVQDLARSVIVNRGATNIWELQAGFAGRLECIGDSPGECTATMQDRTTDAICGRMARRGFNCFAPIREKDLGVNIPKSERPAWAGVESK